MTLETVSAFEGRTLRTKALALPFLEPKIAQIKLTYTIHGELPTRPNLKVAHRPYDHEVVHMNKADVVVLPVHAELAVFFSCGRVPWKLRRA